MLGILGTPGHIPRTIGIPGYSNNRREDSETPTRATAIARFLVSHSQTTGIRRGTVHFNVPGHNASKATTLRHGWESTLTVDGPTRSELQWWLDYAAEWNVCPIVVCPIQMQLITDASHIAWGATRGDLQASWQWNRRLSHMSSNNRKLMAILLAITTFQDIMAGKSIQILTDNVTVMAYIAKKGGPSAELTDISISIWKLCMDKDILIQIPHIRGIDNVEADQTPSYPGSTPGTGSPTLRA